MKSQKHFCSLENSNSISLGYTSAKYLHNY